MTSDVCNSIFKLYNYIFVLSIGKFTFMQYSFKTEVMTYFSEPQSIASLISTGKRLPKIEHLEKIAESKTLNVKLSKLLAWRIKSQYTIEAIQEAAELD